VWNRYQRDEAERLRNAWLRTKTASEAQRVMRRFEDERAP